MFSNFKLLGIFWGYASIENVVVSKVAYYIYENDMIRYGLRCVCNNEYTCHVYKTLTVGKTFS